MNAYLLAALLGVIEGLTEFLPVSSTAHLRIAEALLHMDLSDGYWKMFSIVIQFGAIASLFIYFWRRLLDFILSFPRGASGRGTALTHPLTLTFVAFLCTAGPSYLLVKVIGKNLEDLHIMAAALIIGGVVMIAVDLLYASGNGIRLLTGRITENMEDMRMWQAIWIGLCQVLSAVFPGTSRSMSTIVPGQLAGMTRAAALEFSFFVSIPVMAVATGYELLKTLKPGHGQPDAMTAIHMGSEQWALLGIGGAVSFVVALLSVAWFMQWVRKHGFVGFGIYRILLGAAVWIWLAK